jgi:hypothetical protein
MWNQVLRTLCEPGGLVARLTPPADRDADSQESLERAMLTRIQLSRQSLEELREGGAVVYGVKVTGSIPVIERLATDPLVHGFEPWVRMTIRGAGRLVGPDPQQPVELRPGIQLAMIDSLDSPEVRARLESAMRAPPPECSAWIARQEEIGREEGRRRNLPPSDAPPPPPDTRGLPDGPR